METKQSHSNGKEFLELLLNSVGESVIATNLSGKITYWNRAAEKLYKWEAKEVIGENILGIIPYKTSKKHADEIMNSMKEGKSWEGEFEILDKNGKALSIHAIYSPILNKKGINTGIVISSKDITKEKQAEKLIQENYEEIETQNEELETQNEEIYQANKELTELNKKLKSEKEKSQHYLDIASVMIIALDKNGDVILANKKASQILEYPENEIIGKNWVSHFLPENEKNRVEKILKGIIKGKKEKFKYEKNEVTCKSKKHKFIEWHNTELKNSKGDIIGTLSSGQDITEKIKAEQELNTYINFLDTVMDESPFAMWISDTSGTIIKTNESLRNTLKLKEEQIIGKYNVLQDENLEKQGVMPMVYDVFEKHKPARFSIFWEGIKLTNVDFKKAPSIWIDVSIFPILNNDGELKNVVCQWVDVTEFKQVEDELKKHREKLEELVKERTKELEQKNIELEEKYKELENMNDLFVGREFRIKELKEKIKELEEKLDSN